METAATECIDAPWTGMPAVALHITIIAGDDLAMAVGSPLGALFLLLLIRMAMDARAHVREHRSADQGVNAGYPEDPRVRQGNRYE